MYTVYEIRYKDERIYVGRTKNIVNRTKSHKYSIKSKPSMLYQFARDNNIMSFDLITIRTFKNKTESKRWEMYEILTDHFNKKQLLNKVPNISDR